jgi:uracil-DNA glycosylase
MSWKGFLPENSIIMARRRTSVQQLMFVGEIADPQASQLLDKMIEAMGLKREQVYLANVVNEDEIRELVAQIQPRVIVALGDLAAQNLLSTEAPISQLRGTLHTYRGIQLMPTFHPSHLLQTPSAKKEVWADLQIVAKELGIDIPKKKDN